MLPAHRRHDISDNVWALLEAYLPGREGIGGGRTQDNRRFIGCGILDPAHRCALAGLAARLGRVEPYPPPLHSTAGHRLVERGYDTNAILEQAARQGMQSVIPPQKHRLVQRDYDRYLYKLCSLNGRVGGWQILSNNIHVERNSSKRYFTWFGPEL